VASFRETRLPVCASGAKRFKERNFIAVRAVRGGRRGLGFLAIELAHDVGSNVLAFDLDLMEDEVVNDAAASGATGQNRRPLSVERSTPGELYPNTTAGARCRN
jgi:hypothetical protein